ncbi:MAG TPA: hypothetical protein VHB77_05025, partial [Planctomycetaceae bacterium]|nr:hypothetical protein [Planctomycetaceae bacterium]
MGTNQSLQTAFRTLWISLSLALIAGMALLSQGALPETLATIPAAHRPPEELPRNAPVPRRPASKPVAKKTASNRRPLPQVTLEFEPEAEPRARSLRRPTSAPIDITRPHVSNRSGGSRTGARLSHRIEVDEAEPEDDQANADEGLVDIAPRALRTPRHDSARALEVKMTKLQEQLDRLSDAQSNRQIAQLDQTQQLLQQLQNQSQQQQLDYLSRQLQSLQQQQVQNPPISTPDGVVPGNTGAPLLGAGGGTPALAPTAIGPGLVPPTPPTPAPPPPAIAKQKSDETANSEAETDDEAEKAENTDDENAAPPANATRKPALLKYEPVQGDPERFSLQIRDADLTQVLDMLGQISGMNILASKGVTGKVTANLHDVTIDEALQAILKAGGQAFQRENSFIYVFSAEEVAARQRMDRKLVTRVYRPSYISAKELHALLQQLSTQGVGRITVTTPNTMGIATNYQNAGGDALAQGDAVVAMDYPEVIENFDKIVVDMDLPPAQVVIEAMILSVSLTEALQFGVNFALLNGPNNQLVTLGNGSDLANSTGFPGVPGAQIVPPLANFTADVAGLKYGIIRGDIAMFVQALETIADTNLIATPQIMALNKQRAELIIGTRLSYKTLAFNGTQTVENVNFLDSGTKLMIRPFISPDGLIRMEIHPERSTGTVDKVSGLPNQTTTEVTTNVMVRDGTTLVLGGLIEDVATDQQQRIPYLGALPWVGAAFRNKQEQATRNELIVLITPRIVREPADNVDADAARYENERRAEHFRNTLSPINRRNLTRIEYDRARYYFERGDLNRAHRHITQAVYRDPNDREALHLRDQIQDALRRRNRNWLTFWKSPPPEPVPLPGEVPLPGAPPGA